jgi:hypothetical protein
MTTRSPERPIVYKDRVTQVMLGDHVEVRIWFRKHKGRVVYLPGTSALNPAMERDGLTWIGIRLEEGGFMGALVDPEASFVRTRVTFIRHDPVNVVPLGPDADPYGKDAFLAP